MRTGARYLVSIFLSLFLLLAFLPRSYGAQSKVARVGIIPQDPPPTTTVADPPPTTTAATTTTTSSVADTTTTTTPTTTPTSTLPTSTAPPPTSVANTATLLPPTTAPTTTGNLQTQTDTVTVSQSSTSESAAATSSTSPSSDSGIGTGSIIGLSVAGGVAVFGIVGFFAWKLTRKRFHDFDDNEAIKWPELNTHGGTDTHPLPVNSTGRAGFDTGSEPNSRPPSIITGTTSDVHPSTADPYAVPPLPHLNPNQPYRDEPSPNPYYDPYRGPVPNTLHDVVPPAGWTNAEAIPMTQMAPGARARSPGPQMAYDPRQGQGQGPSPSYGMAPGRQSPGPYSAYSDNSRTGTPGIRSASPGGRRSPGPQAAYDMAYGQS